MVYASKALGPSVARAARFSGKDFVRNLEGLLVLCAWQVQHRSSGGPNLLAKSVCRDMALFIRWFSTLFFRLLVFCHSPP
jgi:hypothetical protein